MCLVLSPFDETYPQSNRLRDPIDPIKLLTMASFWIPHGSIHQGSHMHEIPGEETVSPVAAV